MIRSKNALRTSLVAGAGIIALVLTGCASTDSGGASESASKFTAFPCASDATTDDNLVVGTILPQTGNLAFLNPPEISGVGLAVNEINAAGGVDGKEACILATDSGESADTSVAKASADKLIAAKVSVAIGAASSSVSLAVVDKFADAKILQVSPANTAAELSGYGPFYARLAPPDSVQGSALGQLIAGDGNTSIAFIVFNDAYGTGLRNFTQATFEAAGGTVTYGAEGAGQEFPPGQTVFSSEVTAAIASKPDAIVVLAFDETKAIIPELVAQGWDMSKTYYTDGNTSDYSKVVDPGTMKGAQGTQPGAYPSDAFKAKLTSWYKDTQNGDLKDFNYGPESYDATILAALAAVKAGSNVSADIQKEYVAVSGGSGSGTECKSYADCVKLLKDKKDIHYVGQSGAGPLNDKQEPSSAFIGIYLYDENNVPVWQQAIEGQTSY